MEFAQQEQAPIIELPFDTSMPIETTNQLKRQITEVACIINNPLEDWSLRMKALEHFQKLLTNDNAVFEAWGKDQYVPFLLNTLGNGLISQIEDRRSTLCKEACQTVSVLAQHLQFDFEPFAKLFFPVLMKLLVITIKVMVDSANKCIMSFLPQLSVATAMKLISNKDNEQHPAMRAGSIVYIQAVLNQHKNKIMNMDCNSTPDNEETFELLLNGIKKALTDPAANTRTVAKSTFQELKQLCPHRANTLFEMLDISTQKQLSLMKNATSPAKAKEAKGPSVSAKSRPNFKDFLKQKKPEVQESVSDDNNNNNNNVAVVNEPITVTATPEPEISVKIPPKPRSNFRDFLKQKKDQAITEPTVEISVTTPAIITTQPEAVVEEVSSNIQTVEIASSIPVEESIPSEPVMEIVQEKSEETSTEIATNQCEKEKEESKEEDLPKQQAEPVFMEEDDIKNDIIMTTVEPIIKEDIVADIPAKSGKSVTTTKKSAPLLTKRVTRSTAASSTTKPVNTRSTTAAALRMTTNMTTTIASRNTVGLKKRTSVEETTDTTKKTTRSTGINLRSTLSVNSLKVQKTAKNTTPAARKIGKEEEDKENSVNKMVYSTVAKSSTVTKTAASRLVSVNALKKKASTTLTIKENSKKIPTKSLTTVKSMAQLPLEGSIQKKPLVEKKVSTRLASVLQHEKGKTPIAKRLRSRVVAEDSKILSKNLFSKSSTITTKTISGVKRTTTIKL